MKLTILNDLLARLRKGGAIPLLPLYAFMTWTRTTLLFTFVGIRVFIIKTFSCPTAVAHYLQSLNWEESLIPCSCNVFTLSKKKIYIYM